MLEQILVKKIFADKSKRHKQRKWRLKRLAIEKEESIDTIDDKYIKKKKKFIFLQIFS